jgi:hypothetical protein
MDSKYKNGKIYRIICLYTGKYYYGSTYLTIRERLRNHKKNYTSYLNGTGSYTTSYEIIKNNNFVIELVEEYPCSNKRELEKQEDIYIKKFMTDELCCNKQRAYTTKEERKEYMKEYLKEYKKDYWIEKCDEIIEKRKKKMICECGSIVRICDISTHRKTKKHRNFKII